MRIPLVHLHTFCFRMAIELSDPVQESEIAVEVAKLDPELQFLFDGVVVPAGVQAKIGKLGIHTTNVFAKIEVELADFRKFVKNDIGLDPAAGTANKVVMSKLVNAWEGAQTCGKRRR